MRKLLLVLLACVMLCGCAVSTATDYCEHVWTYRAEFIYDNPNLDPGTAEAEIYALGAVLGMDPETLEEDINDHATSP